MERKPVPQNSLDVSTQSVLGWTSLTCILGSSIFVGGVEPVFWSLLAFFFLSLLAVQLLKDLILGVSKTAFSLWPQALCLLVVLLWLSFQTLPVPVAEWAHPVWAYTSDALPRTSADPVSGYHALVRLMLYISAFWIILRSSEDVERAKLFLQVIGVWSTVMALFGIWTAATGTNPVLGEATGVVSGTFVNRNSYATYAMMGAITNLGVYVRSVSSRSGGQDTRRALRDFLETFFSNGWFYLGGFVVCLAALLGTLSRAGVAAGMTALAMFFIFQRRKSIFDHGLVVLPVLVLILFAALTLSLGVATRFLSLDDESLRFFIYPMVVEGILDRPVLGHGFGAFHDAFRVYVPIEASRLEWDYAHNTYLEMAFEMGLPAAILFYLALAYLLVSMIRGNLRRKRRRIFSNIAIAVTIGCAFHSLFDFSLQIPAVALLFAAIAAIGWAHSKPTRNQKLDAKSESPN